MRGFKDEKHLWKWMRPSMRGKWDRFEVLTMNGFPDVFGSPDGIRPVYIELKVGPEITLDLLESSQVEYLPFLAYMPCNEVWVCFGHPSRKEVRWARVEAYRGLPRLIHEVAPDFFEPLPGRDLNGRRARAR